MTRVEKIKFRVKANLVYVQLIVLDFMSKVYLAINKFADRNNCKWLWNYTAKRYRKTELRFMYVALEWFTEVKQILT